MESILVYLAPAALGLLSKALHQLPSPFSSSSSKPSQEELHKVCLIPPLFDRLRVRNQTLYSPLQQYNACSHALFHHYFTPPDQLAHCHINLSPPESTSHDLTANIYLPRASSNSASNQFLTSALQQPQARCVLRIAPDDNQSAAASRSLSCDSQNFAELILDTNRGGYVKGAACVRLLSGLDLMPKAIRNALQQPNNDDALAHHRVDTSQLSATEDWHQVQTSESRATLSAPSNESALQQAARKVNQQLQLAHHKSHATGQVSLIGFAPLFQATAASCDSTEGLIGVRVDQDDCSAALTLQPYRQVASGWLTASTSQFRGGIEAQVPLTSDPVNPGAAQANVNYALFYSPKSASLRSRLASDYQLGVRVNNNGRELVASYFQHCTMRRRVFNPLAASHIVSHANYLDVGFELIHRVNVDQPSIAFASAYQPNKNCLVKARLTSDCASACLAFKSWSSNISAALTANYLISSPGAGRLQAEQREGASETFTSPLGSSVLASAPGLGSMRFGLSLSFDDIGQAIFGSPHQIKRAKAITSQQMRIDEEDLQ